jgi:hypothetical protein
MNLIFFVFFAPINLDTNPSHHMSHKTEEQKVVNRRIYLDNQSTHYGTSPEKLDHFSKII